MLEENAFVPYSASPPPPGPWLVFAPHADDETFGMGGALLLAGDAGIETHVIVVTDGALGGSGENLVARRQQEARDAAGLLGLNSLQFWSEPDRGVAPDPALVRQCSEEIGRLRPAHVFFPAPFEPHPDHRATARVVWAALGEVSARAADNSALPSPVAYEISVQSPINLLIDITTVMARKRAAMSVYHSQNVENGYPTLVEALDRARTFSLPAEIHYAEGFYLFGPEAPQTPLQAEIDRYYANYWR